MATVLLGNTSPVEAPVGLTVLVNDEEPAPRASAGDKSVVIVDTPDFDGEGNLVPLDKKLLEVRNAFKVHSDSSAAWVEGHDDFFNQAVAQVFGCEIGRPDDWDAPVSPQEPVYAAPATEAVAAVQTEAQEA